MTPIVVGNGSTRTNPRDPTWYPMPNLKIVNFAVENTHEKRDLSIALDITNDGIWGASGVVIQITVKELGLILYDNSASPVTIAAGEQHSFQGTILGIPASGQYTLVVVVDPLNAINETYSHQGGSANTSAEADNSRDVPLTIEDDITDVVLFITITAVAGVLGAILKIQWKRRKERDSHVEIEGVRFRKWG